jgi:DNA-binding CsgD family transcriptional regulator
MYVPMSALRQAVQLVDSLADLDDPARFAGLALPALARILGCDLLTYNEIGPVPAQVRYADYPVGALDPDSRAVFAAYQDEHPLINYYRATGDGRPAKISDFLSQQRFHRLGLYAEFFGRIPVEHQIAITLPGTGTQIVGIAFNRARGDFTDADRELLAVLRGPLSAALLRARARHRAQSMLTTAISAKDADLTDREIQILELVAHGGTNVAIAHRLGVSPRTIAKHLERAYRKLHVTSRAAAVSRAIESQLR